MKELLVIIWDIVSAPVYWIIIRPIELYIIEPITKWLES